MSVAIDKLVVTLKENNEDWNFYPTTNEIIQAVHRDIGNERNNSLKILDIGAGDGNFFKVMEELESHKEENYRNNHRKYAIEKSMILLDQLPSDIFIVGTNFHEQSLIDKQMDVIFCNPPYSEYSEWMEKIIRESNAKTVYMVIPDRWKNVDAIRGAIKSRDATAKVLGDYVFYDSEYRKAMAKVELIKISYGDNSYSNRLKVDPFDVWFEEHFKVTADKSDDSWQAERNKREKLHDMVTGQNIIERLTELYNEEFSHLLGNYKAVELLDPAILKELNISVSSLKGSLKSKIEGLKNIYWKELFDNLDKITVRLTAASRKSLVDTLTSQTSVDFTASNAYSIVIWAIKNANKYFEEQMIKVYRTITNSENVQLYKSNNRIVEDGWRFSRKEMTHYTLDYRIIQHHWKAITSSKDYAYDSIRGLSKTAHELINDIFVIANNLGFNMAGSSSVNREWEAGKKVIFAYLDENRIAQDFAEIKAFKNGNIHFKFNQKFMKAWNIEVSRLLGWIKSPKEAVEEMQDISVSEATTYFNTNLQLLSSDIKLLN